MFAASRLSVSLLFVRMTEMAQVMQDELPGVEIDFANDRHTVSSAAKSPVPPVQVNTVVVIASNPVPTNVPWAWASIVGVSPVSVAR